MLELSEFFTEICVYDEKVNIRLLLKQNGMLKFKLY